MRLPPLVDGEGDAQDGCNDAGHDDGDLLACGQKRGARDSSDTVAVGVEGAIHACDYKDSGTAPRHRLEFVPVVAAWIAGCSRRQRIGATAVEGRDGVGQRAALREDTCSCSSSECCSCHTCDGKRASRCVA